MRELSADGVPAHLLADTSPPICQLVIGEHFANLTDKEKLYAHHISRAAFQGAKVVLEQVSFESPAIYDLIIAIWKENGFAGKDQAAAWKDLYEKAGVDATEGKLWLEYASMFLGNLGNFKVWRPALEIYQANLLVVWR